MNKIEIPKGITQKHLDMLEFLYEETIVTQKGKLVKTPPTIRETMKALGMSTTSMVDYRLLKLREFGFVEHSDTSWGVKITNKGATLAKEMRDTSEQTIE